MNKKLDQFFLDAMNQPLRSPPIQHLILGIGEAPMIESEEEVIYYEFKNSGISLLFGETQKLETIHLFGVGREGFSAYAGPLPQGLSFQNSRSEIVQKLGKPSLEGGGEPSLLGGRISPWIKYLYPNYQLHLQFNESLQKVSLVTLMTCIKTL